MERWKTKTIISDGGYDIVTNIMEQGTLLPGTARKLVNYEPAESRGYRKTLGYIKFDDDTIPGESDAPILGVQPCGSTVFAVRKSDDVTPSYDIHSSGGSGWTKLNSSPRTNISTRARFVTYNLTEQVVVVLDGANPPYKIAPSGNTELSSMGVPTNAKYGAEHLSRLVLAGYSANPGAVAISAPNDDTDFTAASGAIELVVGDTITGLASFREILYIFCANSIHKLIGNSSTNFTIQSVTKRIGCVNGDTIQEVGGDVIYLAPDGFRSLAGTERFDDIELGVQSREIQPDIIEIVTSNPTQYSSVAIPSKSQYRLFIHNSGVDDVSQQGYIGKFKPTETKQYIWSTMLGFNAYSAGSVCNAGGGELQVIGHPTNGYVYRLEASGGFDGLPISYEYKSPPITFDDINILKVLYKLHVLGESEETLDVSVKVILDEYEQEQVSLQPSARLVQITGEGAKFGTAVFDTDVFAELSRPTVKRINIEGSCTTMTIQITGRDTTLPHRIDGYVITYIDKSRKTDQ